MTDLLAILFILAVAYLLAFEVFAWAGLHRPAAGRHAGHPDPGPRRRRHLAAGFLAAVNVTAWLLALSAYAGRRT